MHKAAYFDRISEAYAVLDGIPEHQITLDIEQVCISQDMVSIGVNEGLYIAPSNWDALVMTPDIWLSLCPPYIDIVLPLLENWGSYGIEAFWRIEGRTTSRFEVAMAHLFNLTEEEAEDLFGMRSDEETDSRSDKQVILDRMIGYLTKHGQEITIGIGHVDQDEMLEHGISLPDTMTTKPSDAGNVNQKLSPSEKAVEVSGIETGFAAMALGNEIPGAETLDAEAAASSVSPIHHEQSIEVDQ